MSTGYFLLDNEPVRSQYRGTRRATPTGCIVVHTTESVLDEIAPDEGAENVARYIQRRSTPGSYHRVGDRDSIVKMVPFSYEAYQDGTGSNRFAIGLSLAVQAHTWPTLDETHRDQLVETMAVMAVEAAEWVKAEHGIDVPARRITKAESDAGLPGFIAHGDRDPARRSDPGTGFPWTDVLARYSALKGDSGMDARLLRRIEEAVKSLGYSGIDVDENITEPEAAAVENMVVGIRKLIAQRDALIVERDEARRFAAETLVDLRAVSVALNAIAEREVQ